MALNELDHIILTSRTINLEQVSVTPSKKNRISYIHLTNKKKSQLGLAMNSDYGVLIKNNFNVDVIIKRILIPVKFRDNFSNQGHLQVQLFKEESNKVTSIPLSELYTVEIDKKKPNFFNTPCDDVIISKNTKFFAVL